MKPHVRNALHWLNTPGKSALPILDIFVVSGLLTVFGTRAYLAATGYPQIGGDVLHIAHMLWGGLALAAVLLYLAIALKPNEKLAMFVAGFGFGLFIDELGKFITVDNDYFFRPAASLIIIIFIVLWAMLRFYISKREHKPILPPAEWPTELYSRGFVYTWLILQTIGMILTVGVLLAKSDSSIPAQLTIPYVVYLLALLFVWFLLAAKKRLAAANTLRTIAVLTVIVITPINFYVDQFVAAIEFIFLVLLILSTSKDYEKVKKI